jgi:hypothetical protein
MLTDVVEVRPMDGYQLYLRFEEGVEGFIDVEQARVNSELGAICWPNGADLDPDVLYARLSGRPIPSFEAKKT